MGSGKASSPLLHSTTHQVMMGYLSSSPFYDRSSDDGNLTMAITVVAGAHALPTIGISNDGNTIPSSSS